MTVKQLIEKLKNLPEDLEVLIEDGDNVVTLINDVEDVPRLGDYQCAFVDFVYAGRQDLGSGPSDEDRVAVIVARQS